MAVTPGRRDAIALSGALALVAGSVWIVHQIRTSDNPVNSATVWAAYLGVAALLVSLLAYLISWWWTGRRTTAVVTTAVQMMAAADQLAQRMLETWRLEAIERRISTPAPVRVRWRWGPAEVTPLQVEVSTVPVSGTGPCPLPGLSPSGPDPDPPGMLLDTGIVTRLHDEVYCHLPHGRLVLLGGPGAGKTGAMILLLLAALEHRRNVGEAQRGEVPVPVWLTLGGWNPTNQTLHQWAVATMNRDHPYLCATDYGPDAVGELLRVGRVALFLDGLDEMAPLARAKALARIEQEGAALRLVLCSRSEDYQQTIAEERMHNAAVIELQPVDPEEARAYLVRDQIGAQHDRWVQLGDYLTDHPNSIAAHALNTPLTLSLARVTYQNQDPTPLTDFAKFATVAELREHLIERILITAYPEERQRVHATRWLAWLAHHMGSDRDLAWWRIPAWIPEWQLRLAVVIGVLPAFGIAVWLTNVNVLTAGLIFGFTFGLMGEAGKEPRAVFPRWPRPPELPRLLVFGLAVLLIALLELWTVPFPGAAIATPTATYRIDRQTSIAGGLAGGLVVGLTVALTTGFAYGLGFASTSAYSLGAGFMHGLADMFANGLAATFGAGLSFALRSGSSIEVSLSESVLAATGAGRVKLIQVLEDAHHRQVLRQAGAVYQFRHAELQDHLAKIPRSHIQLTTSI